MLFFYVNEGWDEGMIGMKKGGKRSIAVPPHLGYGSNSRGPVPPNATLVIEVIVALVKQPTKTHESIGDKL